MVDHGKLRMRIKIPRAILMILIIIRVIFFKGIGERPLEKILKHTQLSHSSPGKRYKMERKNKG